MRNKITAWLLGLLGIFAMTGCGCDRPFRLPGCCGRGWSRSEALPNTSVAKWKGGRMVVVTTSEEHWEDEAEHAYAPAPARMPSENAGKEKARSNPAPVRSTLDAARPRVVEDADVGVLPSIPLLPRDFEQLPPLPKESESSKPKPVETPGSSERPSFRPVGITVIGSEKDEFVRDMKQPVEKNDRRIVKQNSDSRVGPMEQHQNLTGQVQQWRKTWRLRYAAVDANDPHGGSVVLEGLPEATRLRDGQNARVSGRLIESKSRTDSPRFVVRSIDLLD